VLEDTGSSSSFFGIQVRDDVLESKVRVGPTYCVSVWVSRGDVRGEMRLVTRRYGSSSAEDTNTLRFTPSNDNWFLFLWNVSLSSTYNRSLSFRTSADTDDGSLYYVDDLRVWESPDGTCDPQCAQ
jgi:hypothetical protein